MKNSIEENIEILEKFKNNEMQRDKLERDGRCGGWKIGDIYKCLELDNAIDNILSDYKRVLKENELLRKDIEGWKKYCEEIREEQTEMSNKNCELKFEVEKLQKENIEQKAEIERRKHDNKTLKEFVSSVFNEELNDKYILTDKQYNAVIENAQNDINQKWIQKVKDKIEEEKLPLTIVGGRKNKKTLEYGIKLGRRQALQELIEEREEK